MSNSWKLVLGMILFFILGCGGMVWFVGAATDSVCAQRKMSYDIAATAMMKCSSDEKCTVTMKDRERILGLEAEILRVCGKVDKREIP